MIYWKRIRRQVIQMDTAEFVTLYGTDSTGEPEQKYRDVMKAWLPCAGTDWQPV